MADRLIPLLCAALLGGAGLSSVTLAQSAAATLPDPTRPPAAFYEPADLSGEAGEITGPVLQSVVIPAKGRPIAVIGGQEVRLGGRYGDNRLIRLTEREAVLEGPEGTLRLPLTPGIEKTNITTKSPAARRAQRWSKP